MTFGKKVLTVFLLIMLIFTLLFNPIISAANIQPIKCNNSYKSLSVSYINKVMLLSKIKFSHSFRRAVEISKEKGYKVDYKHPLFKLSAVDNQIVYAVEFPLDSPESSMIHFIGVSTTKGFSGVTAYLFAGKTRPGTTDSLSILDATNNVTTTLSYKHGTNKLIKATKNGKNLFLNNDSTLNPKSTAGWCAACGACEVACEFGCDSLTGGILFFECTGACYMTCRYPCEKCGW